MQGAVSSLAAERGFGFIADVDGNEFFFHRAALQGTEFDELAEGVAVEFEVGRGEPGDEPRERPRAVNVRLADAAVPAVDHEVLPPEKTA